MFSHWMSFGKCERLNRQQNQFNGVQEALGGDGSYRRNRCQQIAPINFLSWTASEISFIVWLVRSLQSAGSSNLIFAFSLVRCVANLLTSLFSNLI